MNEDGMTKKDVEYFEYRTSSKHLLDLGGRSEVWGAAIEGLKENPKVWVVGTRSVEEFLSGYSSQYWCHVHNAWLQTFLTTGLAGFLLALCFTGMAIKNFFLLLFFRNAKMYQKIGAILLLCILLIQIFEIGLFLYSYPFGLVNALFMFLLGYTEIWVRDTEPLKLKNK